MKKENVCTSNFVIKMMKILKFEFKIWIKKIDKMKRISNQYKIMHKVVYTDNATNKI